MSKKNLVATQLGWVDAEKGKLVTSIRGLPGATKWDPESNTFGDAKPAPKKEVETKPAPKKEVETKPVAPKKEKPAKKATKKVAKKAAKTNEESAE